MSPWYTDTASPNQLLPVHAEAVLGDGETLLTHAVRLTLVYGHHLPCAVRFVLCAVLSRLVVRPFFTLIRRLVEKR